MLEIVLPKFEGWDDEAQIFITYPDMVVQLEHSLVSISKWEARWEIPFLDPRQDKTDEQMLDYIRCMCVNEYEQDFVHRLGEDHVIAIRDYIESKQSATWFSDTNQKSSGEIITSELIYFWMVTAQIPFETQNWHLNRLLTLIKIFGEKNKPKEKMDPREEMERRRALNEQRLKEAGRNA